MGSIDLALFGYAIKRQRCEDDLATKDGADVMFIRSGDDGARFGRILPTLILGGLYHRMFEFDFRQRHGLQRDLQHQLTVRGSRLMGFLPNHLNRPRRRDERALGREEIGAGSVNFRCKDYFRGIASRQNVDHSGDGSKRNRGNEAGEPEQAAERQKRENQPYRMQPGGFTNELRRQNIPFEKLPDLNDDERHGWQPPVRPTLNDGDDRKKRARSRSRHRE